MKKYTVIGIVVIAGLLIGTSVYAQSTPTPTPTPSKGTQCKQASSHTEVYGFCGDKDGIIKKLRSLSVNLLDRRVFVQVTQGASGGEVKLFERKDDGSVTITTWTTAQTSLVLADIDQTMFDNKGINCVGEKVTDVLRATLNNPTITHVTALNTPQAAFTESVDKSSGQFVRTEVVILC
jgi:hypothetical protein